MELVKIKIADVEDDGLEGDPGMQAALAAVGQLSPIIVAKIAPHSYQVIAGRRRVRAMRAAGQLAVWAALQEDTSPLARAKVTLVENLCRSTNPASEARALQVLLDEGWTQEQIAKTFGCSQAQVSARRSLLLLVPGLLAKIEAGLMPPSAGRRAGVLPMAEQDDLLAAAGDGKITLAMVDAAVKAWKAGEAGEEDAEPAGQAEPSGPNPAAAAGANGLEALPPAEGLSAAARAYAARVLAAMAEDVFLSTEDQEMLAWSAEILDHKAPAALAA